MNILVAAADRIRSVTFVASILLILSPASAEIVRFEIAAREPFAEGKEFGEVGSYEQIVGRVYYELDPELPQNANVVDLKLAPRTARGKVELHGDLFILAPKDLSKGTPEPVGRHECTTPATPNHPILLSITGDLKLQGT